MSHANWGQGPYPGDAYANDGAAEVPGAERRIDLLDVVEGVLTDGFSLSNFTRIARASGSNFWIGAAIGAGLVVLAHRPDVRAAAADAFNKSRAKPKAPEAATANAAATIRDA
ncbi:hypothetical protein Msil_2907 [Methylocella silvestris BL2]|uniref:Uncharacterized protein n=1 Tax=Methylocella silvestris (strain DSM 15510 / CIP 108128 / LMG 27833 / NCIMB 13906 / BL2) TaxID=395965 RepID=B8EIK6_METSB|nr:hypothetical protein [Methylocella silvestris]ACK51823.1 hypothetical protein Msil_2907 [Methylocella silvestris BL2]